MQNMKTIEMKRTLSILCLLSFSLFMNGQQATGYTKTRNYTAERTYMDASSQTVAVLHELSMILSIPTVLAVKNRKYR